MEGKDNIKELFSQKLGNYEAPVNPELWAKISSQVAAGATTTTAATGLSVLAKVGIGLGISAAAITTVVLLTSSPNKETVPSELPKEVQKEIPTSTTDEKERVAELSTEKGQNDLGVSSTNTRNDRGTSEASLPFDNPNPTPLTVDRDTPTTLELKTKDAHSVTTGTGIAKPTIIELVRSGEATSYKNGEVTIDPAILENTEDPKELEESTTPKVEPITRYVNVFTPNGDRENDEFFLESEGLTDFYIVVFNPAGDIVFKSNDPQFRWDGRDMRTGEMVDSGNYMYMVSSEDADGNPHAIYEQLVIKY